MLGEPWVDMSDMVILGVLAVGVFWYFTKRTGNNANSTTSGGSLGSQPSSNNLKTGSSSANLGSVPSSSAKLSKLPVSGLNAKLNYLKKDSVIFYGSQTGTAEDYSNRLAREGRQYGFDPLVADIEEYDMSELADLEINKFVIFVLATYGEGEPTDNAQEAFKYFNEQELERDFLKTVRYTVFGLGNKTYEHYNEVGKFFDSKLEHAGATRVFELGLGDDDGSLEEDYMTWRDKMWPAAANLFGKEIDQNAATLRQYKLTVHDHSTLDMDRVYKGHIGKLPKPGALQTSPPYDLKNPYFAEIVVNRELMKGGSRNCMHIEVKIKDTPLTYQSGDHLGIFPNNDPAEVENLGRRLGIENMDQIITLTAVDTSAPKKHPFPCPCSYRTALTHYLDIHGIARSHILKALIEYTADEEEKQKLIKLISPESKEELHKFLHNGGRSILDVLESFPSAHPPADLIFELLPRLQCRYYSISSSPEVHPDTISICATVAEYQKATRLGKGVCTSWLFALKNPEMTPHRIPVFVRRSNFKLPKALTKPVLMIGPGTGVAPMRAFIEERAKKSTDGKQVGPTVLFFGCRRRNEDFLYDDELLQYQKDGKLELFTAFSREEEGKKVYVQHLMAEQSKLIWGYLEHGGYVYVCGDAKNMARDVNKTLVEIAKEIGGKSEEQAIQYVKNLRSQSRYLEDVWS